MTQKNNEFVANDMITNYKDLPLGVYLEIQRINNDETRELVDRQVAILALLCDKSEREILNLPITEYSDLAAKCSFLEKEAQGIGKPASRYKLGDFTLVPSTNLSKVTTAQYIDFQAYAPKGVEAFVELLSVMLVPEGKAYADGYDVAEVQDAIRVHLSVHDALTLSADFFAKWLALTQNTLNSLEKEAKKAQALKAAGRQSEIMKKIVQTKMLLETSSKVVGAGLRKLTS